MKVTEILNRLKTGNENFVNSRLYSDKQDSSRREDVINGQDPFAVILSCADSRVIPELIFDTGIGELFVIRVAGNIANISTVASIEYAVAHLNTNVIVVLGHENCGAVNAALTGGHPGDNLKHLLSHIKPAINESADGADPDAVARKNAELTVEHLTNRSPIISKAVDAGELEILPAYYHLSTGQVDFIRKHE